MTPADEVFEYWKVALNYTRARLDVNRRAKINARLKDGYSLDDLKTAIEGCTVSNFHQGVNKDSTVYDDIELICRDAKHVDMFIKIAEKHYGKLNAEEMQKVKHESFKLTEDQLEARRNQIAELRKKMRVVG